jgi:hypothetical protein
MRALRTADRLMLSPTPDDDPDFHAIASRILKGSIDLYQPAKVHIVHIDSWFDANWLDFSGKVLGAIAVWRKNISIPPFHPNRVLLEAHFDRDPYLGRYSLALTAAVWLHRYQPSSENLNRSLTKLFDSAILFWYSGATARTRRGSLMQYRVSDGEVYSWYASYHCAPEWKVLHTMQISKAELAHLEKSI